MPVACTDSEPGMPNMAAASGTARLCRMRGTFFRFTFVPKSDPTIVTCRSTEMVSCANSMAATTSPFAELTSIVPLDVNPNADVVK